MKRNEEIIINIEEMDTKGLGIGYIDNKKIKVKNAILGEKVKVRVKKIKNDIAEANIIEIIEKSPIERENKCKHFGECGGCTYQNIDYKEQIKIKADTARKLFKNEGLEGFEFLEIETSPKVHEYRNKMEYTFGKDKEGSKALGLHKKGRFNEIVTTDECNIVDEDFNKLLKLVLNFSLENGIPFYNSKTHEGFLRHLVVRKASINNELLVNIVSTSQIDYDFSKLADKIKNTIFNSKLVGILHTQNDSLSDAVILENLNILYGRDYLIEKLLGLKFKINAFSFFQTNSYGAELLYKTVREFAGEILNKTVFDLYCGTGTIGIIMAPMAKKVIGIELVEESVKSARENAEINKLENIIFFAGDVAEKLKEINETPDIVILDPPRSGVNYKALEDIINFNPEKIIYVSCNIESLVRDLKILNERGYNIDKIKCVDMFPHTYHLECVVRIQRKK